ncbi:MULTISPECIES: lipoyl(octanoyl) transferase LipB [unclassified Thioalkalivibrio]|uniref:lipoyl(octanoyl) transferase LipB n=1 Tax=unclassified Thioalkalivibrio TaxID=2621013 RepID=UPI00036955CA|nr:MULTISPECIES: lipoyl(octanoyl) transferase LipB [unclassified Thioalkalivibrio]
MTPAPVEVRELGLQPYVPVWQAMQLHGRERAAEAPDALWCVQHPPVFTQGRNGRPEHLLDPGAVPVVAIDRGGQITYHGPGQLVVYTLLDLRRLGIGVRRLVACLEQAIIDTLAQWGIEAERRANAPGVYVGQAKIAALGLRVRHARSIHGLALNVAPVLAPFARINPCGYAGLPTTSMQVQLGGPVTIDRVRDALLANLAAQLFPDRDSPFLHEPALPAELVRVQALGRCPAP